jgi:hypothetical protein
MERKFIIVDFSLENEKQIIATHQRDLNLLEALEIVSKTYQSYIHQDYYNEKYLGIK